MGKQLVMLHRQLQRIYRSSATTNHPHLRTQLLHVAYGYILAMAFCPHVHHKDMVYLYAGSSL